MACCRRHLPLPQQVASALLGGSCLVQGLPRLWPATVSLGLIAAAGLWALRAGPAGRMAALMMAGICWAAFRGQSAVDARLPRDWEGRDFVIVGQIVELPQASEGLTRFVMDVRTDAGPRHWRGRARLSWYHPPELQPCQRWRLQLRLRRPRGMVNPGSADSERAALEHGIQAVGYVRAPATARPLAARRCIDGARARLAQRIEATLPGRHAAALLRAFAVGDVRGLEEGDWAVARANGIPHLIAISGFHVGMAGWMGAVLVLGLYRLWPELGLHLPRPLAAQGAVVLVAAAYCALAGFGIPCVRTLLMMAVALLHRLLRRAAPSSRSWWLALAVVLLVDPLACLSAGFWLSFVGVALLMGGLQGEGRGLRGWWRDMTLGQWLMTASMLPLSLWFFGEASWVGALSNLLAVPWISFVVVPMVLLSLPLLWFGVPWAGGLLWLAAGATDGLWQVLIWLGRWPGAHWQPPTPGLPALLLAMAGMIWLWMPRGMPLRALAVPLLLPLLWPARPPPAEGGCRLWALDVGQGLAVLVQTHRHLLVYDAGARYPSGYDLGEAVVLPAIRALGLGRVDLLMISHGDNDHAGGAAAVARAFPSARRLSGEPSRMPYASRACRSGQHWQWDGVAFQVLAPAAGASGRGNQRSCVLLLTAGGGRLLLTGDIGLAQEQALLPVLAPSRPTLLQVPHHGSRHGSGTALLDRLQPAGAWVSAGWRNRFGHPHPVVRERYRVRAIPLWNTADSGALQFELAPGQAPRLVARWRLQRRRYWRE